MKNPYSQEDDLQGYSSVLNKDFDRVENDQIKAEEIVLPKFDRLKSNIGLKG